ncbi:extracellular solute-binding protein [Paenibacillus eucommiae]|uniref:Aldouronate transport system substrate-binding protein n=1 Tax=Paenibacillus eucommiae TaxID=1355755 RepID=A0ABS4J3B1_9BACL|nr:extracellular solute-binding protein [Paenibacillus eucommiae]MBP1993775.1 putative aldouronate transport system substrate-binding protein [Paenibacillus eucommiae]
MNKKRMQTWGLISLCILMLFVTACSGKDKSDNSSNNTNTNTTQNEGKTDNTNTQESTPNGAIDPLGKYDPPIEMTAVRAVSAGITFKDGESIENNVWSRDYEERLGIKVKYLWTADDSDYDQKLNIAISSGGLADIMLVNATQLKQMVDSDQAEDLTEVFEKYGSTLTKEIVRADKNQMSSVTFDGKMMAIPRSGSESDQSHVLWVRADWLKKLNLPEPKTMQDVLKISEAFTKSDPDGNSKADTYGLAITNTLHLSGSGSLKPFFNGYHAYVNHWIKDASGKLVYGSVQPEVKPALAKLQEMYLAGQLDKEFPVKDGGKVLEQLISSKIGMMYGPWYGANYPLQMNKTEDPSADWRAYGIPSIDATPAKIQLDFPVSQYFVVRKGAKNPEAAVKMLNLMVDNAFSERANIEKYFIDKDGFRYNNYALLFISPVNANLQIHLNLKKALENNDPSKLTIEEKGYYDVITAYRAGDNSAFREEGKYGNVSAWPYVIEKLDNGLVQSQEFFGAPTATMSEKGAILEKMMMETFTKIIMGESKIDEFDTFVNNWHKLGGDQITREVNDWAAQRK